MYCWSRATFGSPLSVCMPPAACHVEPAVSSRRSRSITSVQPSLVRWYRTLAPTTPPPMTTTWVSRFIDSLAVRRPPCPPTRSAGRRRYGMRPASRWSTVASPKPRDRARAEIRRVVRRQVDIASRDRPGRAPVRDRRRRHRPAEASTSDRSVDDVAGGDRARRRSAAESAWCDLQWPVRRRESTLSASRRSTARSATSSRSHPGSDQAKIDGCVDHEHQ